MVDDRDHNRKMKSGSDDRRLLSEPAVKAVSTAIFVDGNGFYTAGYGREVVDMLLSKR